jgi:flavodoxin
MEIAVVYYSLEGHTDFIARKIWEQIGAVPIRLFPRKEFPNDGFLKYFWCGKSSVFHDKPELSNEPLQLESYDTIVVGTPTWAGSMTSPIRSFLSHEKLKGKNVYLFACNSGGKDDKCFAQMSKYLEGTTLKGWVSFKQPDEENFKDIKDTLDQFCKAIKSGKQYP